MTTDFENLLHLLSCSALQRVPSPERDYNFEEIYRLSLKQQVHTLVFPVIEEMKASGLYDISDRVFDSWKNRYVYSVVFAEQRRDYMSGLFKKLESDGISYCVLKGEALSHLYPRPESRISSDVDLWIENKDDMHKVAEYLREDGFNVGKTDPKSHQTECKHQKFGLIELHSDISDGVAKKIWFEDKISFKESFIKVKDQAGSEFYTLSVTDGAIFVTFHFIKHFLSHGCGCRQLLDMLLYLKAHEDEIDFDKYNSVFTELHYMKFINICKAIGKKYMDTDLADVPDSDDEICREVLSDIESGGVFGQDEEFRKSFTGYYTKKRNSGDAGQKKVMISSFRKRAESFLRNRNYNPVRIVCDLLRISKNRNTENNTSLINKRLEMFEDLGFFEGNSDK